jgi:hypothetical protein
MKKISLNNEQNTTKVCQKIGNSFLNNRKLRLNFKGDLNFLKKIFTAANNPLNA